MSSFHYCELFALCMCFRYWQCLESSLWLEVRSAVLSYQFDSRSDPIFFCKEKGFNRVRSLSMHSPYCLFVSHCCLSNKNITYPSGDMKFLSFYQKNNGIWLVHSTKQSMILYLFRKISSQYGTEMLQTKQPQQELGKSLSKFILKNHTISKSPPPIPPPPPKYKYKICKYKIV